MKSSSSVIDPENRTTPATLWKTEIPKVRFSAKKQNSLESRSRVKNNPKMEQVLPM